MKEGTQTRSISADEDHQESCPQREILEKIPEQGATSAIRIDPKVAGGPEPLVEHRRRDAISRENECAHPVCDTGDDRKRTYDLNGEPADEYCGSERIRLEYFLRLADRLFESQDLIERAERQK